MRKYYALILCLQLLLLMTACSPGWENGTVSYVGWSDRAIIREIALNRENLVPAQEFRHLPIYKCETAEELTALKTTLGEVLHFTATRDDAPAAQAVLEGYGAAFFDKNALLIVYVEATSGSYRYQVENITKESGSICVRVKESVPDIGTDDMAGWLVVIPAEKSWLSGVTSYDSIME